MNDNDIEILTQLRLLQWAIFTGDKGKMFFSPEPHGHVTLKTFQEYLYLPSLPNLTVR